MCSAPRRAGTDAVTAFHASVTQLTESRTSNPVDASSNLAGGFPIRAWILIFRVDV